MRGINGTNAGNSGLKYFILKIACWNIEGLLKYDSSPEFKDCVKTFDSFGFCETWSNCLSEFDSFIYGYKCFNKIGKKRFKKVLFCFVLIVV